MLAEHSRLDFEKSEMNMTREELYELVWSQPMTEVAKSLGVSGSYMARVCTHLSVPRPNLGYWAKHAVGKAPPRPHLPAASPGDQLSWSKGETLPPSTAPRHVRGRDRAVEPQGGKGMHPLLRGAKELFQNGWPVEEGRHLKPRKKLIADITATVSGLDKAIRVANELFNALESVGYRVTFSTDVASYRPTPNIHEIPRKQNEEWERMRLWRPNRSTLVYVGDIAIGLSIVEMIEQVEMRYVRGKYVRASSYTPPKDYKGFVDPAWTPSWEMPSGRYRMIAYSPYHRVRYSIDWQDKPDASLNIKEIVKALPAFADELSIKLAEARREEEIRRQKWLEEQDRLHREEDKRRIAQSIRDSRDGLSKVMQDWAYTLSVEEFFKGVERRAKSSDVPEARRQKILKRLRLARDFLGTQDPVDFLMSWRTPLERYQPKYPESQ